MVDMPNMVGMSLDEALIAWIVDCKIETEDDAREFFVCIRMKGEKNSDSRNILSNFFTYKMDREIHFDRRGYMVDVESRYEDCIRVSCYSHGIDKFLRFFNAGRYPELTWGNDGIKVLSA